jgi:hypothetical protein
MMPRWLIVLAAGTFSITSLSWAGDINDLTRDLPLRMQDARPTDKGELQLQGTARWERTDAGQDRTLLQPQLQYGLTDDLQLQVQAPFYAGDADRSGSGDVQLAAQYRLVRDDGRLRPSVALAAQLTAPTGVGSDGLDTQLELDLSKGIRGDDNADLRAHLNLLWDRNAAAASDERHDRFTAIVGCSYKLNDKTLLLADFVREQQPQEGLDTNLVEAGIVRALTDHFQVAAGAGAGIGDDSPSVVLTLGVQYSF